MNKELQNKAWSVLPNEFKEEVKKEYHHILNGSWRVSSYLRGRLRILRELFGLPNLTSDTEPEVMIMCARKKVQNFYDNFKREKADAKSSFDKISLGARLAMLQELFGSKCLPDLSEVKRTLSENLSEQKPAEPKFKIGDKVKHSAHPHDDGIYRVDDIKKSSDGFIYHIQGLIGISNVKESDLEPYTEQKEVMRMKPIESKVSVYLATAEEDEEFRLLLHENGFKWNNETSLISLSCWSSLIEDDKIHYVHPDKTVTYCGKKTSDTLTFSEFKKQYFGENVNHRQFIANCDKQFDNILKDSFRNERRLNIAAMAMQGIVSNPTAMNGPKLIDGDEEILAKWSLKFADALIDECELTEK